MKSLGWSVGVWAVGVCVVAEVAGQPASPVTGVVRERVFTEQPGRGEEGGWVLTLSPTSEVTLPSSYDDVDLTVSRLGLDLSSEYWFSRQVVGTFGVGTEWSHYALSGFNGEVGLDEPISNAVTTTLRPGARFNFSRAWGAFGFGILEFSGDPGADWDKSFTGGGAAGASWSPNEDLRLLFGAGATSALDDTASFFPVLGVNWKFAERWSLETLGTGGAVRYRLDDTWTLSAGGRYESRDYRLDDDASVPDGVLRDDRALVEVSATYRPRPGFDITAGVGAVVWSELTVDSAGSDEVFEATGDVTAVLGLRGVVRF
ncbi:MAG: DUF6268 family outer membrane beta-barrel protein [Planctomycetota bacterium]